MSDPDLYAIGDELRARIEARSITKPPDDRLVDPAKMRELRELFASPRGWTGAGANAALVRALYDGIVKDGLARGKCWQIEYAYPYPFHPSIGAEEKPDLHYESFAIVSVPDYTGSMDAAERLQKSLLPDQGYAARVRADEAEVCLLSGQDEGPWQKARTGALALVCAILEHLERHPGAAAAYRRV